MYRFAHLALIAVCLLSGAAIAQELRVPQTLQPWAAALTLGIALLAAAGLAAVVGRHMLKGAQGFPRTIATIEETTRWPLQSKS